MARDSRLANAHLSKPFKEPGLHCRVSIVAEQFVRMLHHVGMPKTDLDYIQGNGRVVGEILKKAHPRSTLFTGSQKVAEQLALDLKGKVGVALQQ